MYLLILRLGCLMKNIKANCFFYKYYGYVISEYVYVYNRTAYDLTV